MIFQSIWGLKMGWLDRPWGSPPALTEQLMPLGQSLNTGVLKRAHAKLGMGHRLETQHSDEGRVKPEGMEFRVNLGYVATTYQKERRKTGPEL